MQFNKILVPVAGTKADEEAMELACILSRQKNKGMIFAVHVIPVERSLPLDSEIESEISRADSILAHIEETAQGEGCRVETDLLQAREVGPAIVDEAIERQVDTILIGVSYKKHFGQFSLGDVVPYVLKNAPCRIILHHQLKT